jgi:16S rRNA (cytosine967-C5)-methyltransferase
VNQTVAQSDSSSAAAKQSALRIAPARLAAFEILKRVENERAYAGVLLAAREERLSPADRALCHELVMGVLRNRLWLDALIEHYANRRADRLDLPVLLALRIGLYQMRFLSRIPAAAAVNDSVSLATRARLRSAASLVNAVLRRAAREPDFDPLASIDDPIERAAIETSHPAWLIEHWTNAIGFESACALARANNQRPPVSFRVVNSHAGEAEVREAGVIAALEASGATVTRSKIARGAWRIEGGGELLREYAKQGTVYQQDEASQLVAEVVEAQPGERVLDLCAAPGGKALQVAHLTRGLTQIVAGDIHLHRLRQVRAAATAQRLSGIDCVVLDARVDLPFPEASFDRVLVDAPCTGTGTLRRNPEIRGRISPADVDQLSDRQTRILLSAAKLVRPGGRLVYSTCSVEFEEGEAVAARLVSETGTFSSITPPVTASLVTGSAAVRTWPQRDDVDGFFIAAFQRCN